jgi:hypothetical protein
MSDERWGRLVTLTFGNTELVAAPRRPHELDRNKVGRIIYEHLSKTLADTGGPSLARTIYDALSLKPGVLGVSLDLKILLETIFPKLKEGLNDLRLNKADFARLQILVGANGTALSVPTTEAKRALGERLFERLAETGVLFVGAESVHVHDLIADVISAYTPVPKS